MNQARSGTGIDSILTIYARMAPQERTGLQSWCLNFSSRGRQFRVGELVLWRRPGKNSVQPNAGSTMRS